MLGVHAAGVENTLFVNGNVSVVNARAAHNTLVLALVAMLVYVANPGQIEEPGRVNLAGDSNQRALAARLDIDSQYILGVEHCAAARLGDGAALA